MIDILMASYNGEDYIKEQIESIMSQTNRQWTLHICDDRSSDKSAFIAEAIARSFNQEEERTGGGCRIYTEVNEKAFGGACGNFMHMLKMASAEYVMFCDQDDVWDKDKVSLTLQAMKRLESKYGKDMPLYVYTDLEVVDKHLQTISPSFMKYMNLNPHMTVQRLLFQNSAPGCTMMLNRALYALLLRADDMDQLIMHDHFAALIGKIFGHGAYLPKATMKYRIHGNNSVGASDGKSISYLWQRFMRGKAAFKKDLYHSMVQAEYICRLYEDELRETSKESLVRGYADLMDKGKIERMKFYLKNRVIKYGFIRAVMQFVWG